MEISYIVIMFFDLVIYSINYNDLCTYLLSTYYLMYVQLHVMKTEQESARTDSPRDPDPELSLDPVRP